MILCRLGCWPVEVRACVREREREGFWMLLGCGDGLQGVSQGVTVWGVGKAKGGIGASRVVMHRAGGWIMAAGGCWLVHVYYSEDGGWWMTKIRNTSLKGPTSLLSAGLETATQNETPSRT